MILDKVQVDWLTLTEFQDNGNRELWRCFRDGACDGVREQAKIMQYVGVKAGSAFYGTAEQKGKRHAMLRVSGQAADKFFRLHGDAESVGCSRIDIQKTVRVPAGGYSGRIVCDLLREAGADEWKGRARKVTLIDGGGGMDTVYVGSRTSETFIRIYVKEIVSGERVLRFECEFKGDKADRIKRGYWEGRASLENVLGWEWSRLPAVARHYMWFMSDSFTDDETVPIDLPAEETEDTNGMKWFRGVVVPWLIRMIDESEHHVEIEKALRAVLDRDR